MDITFITDGGPITLTIENEPLLAFTIPMPDGTYTLLTVEEN